MTRTPKAEQWLDKALTTILEPTPAIAPKGRVIDQKELKRIGKQMELGARELARMDKRSPLTTAERKELRAEQQRARRASKAISEVLL
jgi:hypothetical protein